MFTCVALILISIVIPAGKVLSFRLIALLCVCACVCVRVRVCVRSEHVRSLLTFSSRHRLLNN